ncbi:MAG: hypothetical protein HDS71_02065 [Bacteroidales bacterium]|nr:hypothetical protein [Bacteroidales bacterium]MBD5222828.1 hypothetical protein [Bacteroidales bacterium]MBD5302218.1 hypothetical protein [Bacteroides sp.]
MESNTVSDNTEALEEAGLEAYQLIVDNCETCGDELSEYVARLRSVDNSGQFLTSAAIYLAALDRDKFNPWLTPIIEGAIEKDRERRYIGSLLQAIWGEDFMDNVEKLSETDNNFRRIYKRIYPDTPL